MTLRWYTVVVDCADPASQAHWWGGVLGWPVVYEAADEVVIVPPHALTEAAKEVPLAERSQGLVFGRVPEGKSVKNRLHVDLAPGPDDDQQAEVERLIELGARHADVGQQPENRWVVLADPEGNEFCVLTPRD
jgi:hypothetical protein